MGDAIIGVAAAGDQRRNVSAEAVNPGVRSKRDDFAGNFQAEHISHAGRRRIVALALMDIRSVDACGFDPNQNLALRRNRTRAEFNLERLRTARAGRDNCAHSLPLIGHLTLLAFRPDRSGRLALFRQSPIAEAVAPSSGGAARNAGSASARAQNAPRLG